MCLLAFERQENAFYNVSIVFVDNENVHSVPIEIG